MFNALSLPVQGTKNQNPTGLTYINYQTPCFSEQTSSYTGDVGDFFQSKMILKDNERVLIKALSKANARLEAKIRRLEKERQQEKHRADGLELDLNHAIEQVQVISAQQKQDNYQYLWHNLEGSSCTQWRKKFKSALRDIFSRENSAA